jgi:hypothetical protein
VISRFTPGASAFQSVKAADPLKGAFCAKATPAIATAVDVSKAERASGRCMGKSLRWAGYRHNKTPEVSAQFLDSPAPGAINSQAMASAEITQSIFDLTSAAGAQFFAMLLGAFLASLGGFSVAWVLDRLERKREERSTALIMLDLLTTLHVMTNLARDARGRGDPYGPLTMRLITTCRRDLEVYQRNRERIADISDPEVRSQIYTLMVRISMAVDGIVSETEMVASIDEAIEAAHGNDSKIETLTRDRGARTTRRDASFDFMVSTMNESWDSLSKRLREISNSPSGNVAEIIAGNTASVRQTRDEA